MNLERNGVQTQVKAVLKGRTDLHECIVNVDCKVNADCADIELIIIRDCDTNFSGDENIDFMFNTIGEDDGPYKISKTIIITIEDKKGKGIRTEMEVVAEIIIEKNMEETEEIDEDVSSEAIELAPIVNSSRLKSMDRLKLKKFNAYPNPTDGILNISFSGKKGGAENSSKAKAGVYRDCTYR